MRCVFKRPLPIRLSWCRALLLTVALVALPAYGALREGQPLAEALRELEARGLALIWSSDLVDETLRVRALPPPGPVIDMARAVLAPHGLALRDAGTGWVVVRAPAPRRAPQRLDEIIVSTSRYRLLDASPGSTTVLSREEFSGLPKVADDALKAVHRLPGAASNGISGLAHIRGGEENETGIVLDHMVLADPFHLKSLLSPVSVLDAAMIGALEVHAGALPIEYGERTAAIIDVTSLAPGLAPRLALGLSLFHTQALASGGTADGRGEWLVTGRRSNLDELADTLDSEIGEARYLDSFGRLSWALRPGTKATVSWLVSRDEAEVNEKDRSESAESTYRNVYLWTTLEHRWSETLSGLALLSLTDVADTRDGTVDEPGVRSGFVDDRRSWDVAGLRLELEAGDQRRLLRLGLGADRRTARYAYDSLLQSAADTPFPGEPSQDITRRARLRPAGHALAGWAAVRGFIAPRLVAEAGLRWDTQTWDKVSAATQWSPRLGLRLDTSPALHWRAGWERHYQPQGIHELQVEDGVTRFFPAQRVDQLIVGVDWQLRSGLDLRLEAYVRDYDDLQPRFENLYDPLVLVPELRADRIVIVPTSAAARGIELHAGQRLDGGWRWWLGYAWSRATDTVEGRRVLRSWDQRHSLDAGIQRSIGPWELTLAGAWHSGWPTTEARLVDDGGTLRVVAGPRNAARFGNYATLDLRAARRWRTDAGEWLAFIELGNALARRNACCSDYTLAGTPEGDPVLRRDEDHWPRFLPNVGVTWQF